MKKKMEMSRISEMVEKAIGRYQGNKDMLIQILIDLQSTFGWLSEEVLKEVSRCLEVPITRVYRIATFYKAFSLAPRGRHVVTLCMGTACQVRGAPRLLDRIALMLKVKPGKTTTDGRFTLDTVNCLGCCALGPVVVVDETYHSNPSTQKLEKIFEEAR